MSDGLQVRVSRIRLNLDGIDEKLKQIRQLPEGDKIVHLAAFPAPEPNNR